MLSLDPHALYELDILRTVEQDCHLTNRMAARKLGVSLKLAHQVLRRMIEKGLLYVRVVHSRRWDYFLTAKGIAEKTRLTLEFLEFSMRFYREARRRSSGLCHELARRGTDSVAFVGAGDMAEIVYLGVQEEGLTLTEVYGEAQRRVFMGVRVSPYEAVGESAADAIIVCCYDSSVPMKEHFLPLHVRRHPRMCWVFGAEADQGDTGANA